MNAVTTGLNSEERRQLLLPRTFQAIHSQTFDLSLMLIHLDSKLRILENNKSLLMTDYQAYAEAIVFLKAAYLFFRVLLDTLASVIEYFYKKSEKINLPSTFKSLMKKQRNGKLPKDLSLILKKVHIWFPEFATRRDDLVHHYESFLIMFRKDRSGVNILEHYSDRAVGNKLKSYGEIRHYFGFLLSGYQRLIDELLDHFDTKFRTWYGIIASKSSQTQTYMEGNAACMLWWAAKYGDYQHPDLVVQE
jgi:hypothetical protein